MESEGLLGKTDIRDTGRHLRPTAGTELQFTDVPSATLSRPPALPGSSWATETHSFTTLHLRGIRVTRTLAEYAAQAGPESHGGWLLVLETRLWEAEAASGTFSGVDWPGAAPPCEDVREVPGRV